MAIYFARKSGNVNATDVWATTPSGSAGDFFSSFTSEDVLMSNDFTITINVDLTVLEIRNDSTNGATQGGTFSVLQILNVPNNITINANIFSNNINSTSGLTINFIANSILNINGNITGGGANSTSHGLDITGTNGTVNIIGNLIGGVNSSAVRIFSIDTILNVTGNICETTFGASGITIDNKSIINIVGNIFSTGTAGGASYGLRIGGGSIVNITGNILGVPGRAGNPIRITGAATVNFTGNILNTVTSNNIYVNAVSTTNITGNVYGGNLDTTSSIFLNQLGTVNILGNCIGGNLGPAVFNNTNGTVNAKRATGNGFGSQSAGKTSQPGIVNNSNTGYVYVEEIEYGELGQSPTSGPIILTDNISNIAVFAVRSSGTRSLVDSNNVYNLIPSSNDVRNGVIYNLGTSSGTCFVPHPNSVVYGVGVDQTIGSGLLSPEAVWNVLSSNIVASGSIGQRLKNCSTVAIVGKQLEGVL
jgi:hypothetical protein